MHNFRIVFLRVNLKTVKPSKGLRIDLQAKQLYKPQTAIGVTHLMSSDCILDKALKSILVQESFYTRSHNPNLFIVWELSCKTQTPALTSQPKPCFFSVTETHLMWRTASHPHTTSVREHPDFSMSLLLLSSSLFDSVKSPLAVRAVAGLLRGSVCSWG